MLPFVDEQLELLSRQVESIHYDENDVAAQLFDLEAALSFSVEAFKLLQRKASRECPEQQWDESAARRLLPDYQRWFALGERLLALLRSFRAHGHRPEGTDAFMHAYLECKPIATNFDGIIAFHERWLRGDRSYFRPFQEIMNELQPATRGVGGGSAA